MLITVGLAIHEIRNNRNALDLIRIGAQLEGRLGFGSVEVGQFTNRNRDTGAKLDWFDHRVAAGWIYFWVFVGWRLV